MTTAKKFEEFLNDLDSDDKNKLLDILSNVQSIYIDDSSCLKIIFDNLSAITICDNENKNETITPAVEANDGEDFDSFLEKIKPNDKELIDLLREVEGDYNSFDCNLYSKCISFKDRSSVGIGKDTCRVLPIQ